MKNLQRQINKILTSKSLLPFMLAFVDRDRLIMKIPSRLKSVQSAVLKVHSKTLLKNTTDDSSLPDSFFGFAWT